jgi:mono/diheme cytochrome c family protein
MPDGIASPTGVSCGIGVPPQAVNNIGKRSKTGDLAILSIGTDFHWHENTQNTQIRISSTDSAADRRSRPEMLNYAVNRRGRVALLGMKPLVAVQYSADPERGNKTMTTRFITRTLAIAAILLPLGLQAQSFSDFQNLAPEERRAYLDSMSEQERQAKREQWRAEREAMTDQERTAMREQMRAHRDSMSEEERQAMRENMRSRWDGMSEEERQAKREQMQIHRDSMTPEQRQAMREQMRAHWEGMSDEERAATRERRAHRHHHDGGRHKGGS